MKRRRRAPAGGRAPADAEAVFAALAHASRRQILLVLHFRGAEMTAGDIADRFACAWPTTTRHLGVLESAGLVQVRKRGRERVYRLDRARLFDVAGGWLRWFRPGGPAPAPVKGRRRLPRKRARVPAVSV